MNIQFFGAINGVTGSQHLLTINNKKILIDCGLFQGDHQDDLKNWDDFAYNPSEIDALILTHSHLDHIGLVPKLCKSGFSGPIYATAATRDFAEIFFEDSQHLLEGLTTRINKPVLYELEDIPNCMKQFKPIEYHKKTKITDDISFTFYDAGHILGSAFVEIKAENKTIVFSGDLGNPPVPIIKDTEFITNADYVVMESTYGNRTHTNTSERIRDLEKAIEDAFTRNGVLLIPAFAMERTQELLYEINELITQNQVPKIPVFMDSPLALKATNIYPKYKDYIDEEALIKLEKGKNLFDFPQLKMIESITESKAIDADDNRKIIIAGSGMSTGGRIIFHEKRFLSNPNTTLLIIGYQVQGTLGRALQDGIKHIRIHGEPIEVRANIINLNSYSAHADQPKLLYWLAQMKANVKKVFLVHGEDSAKQALQTKINDELGLSTHIPINNKEIKL